MSEKIDFGLILKESASLPLVRIDRESFLKTALSPYYDKETVEKAIYHNPAYAGITVAEIKKIAKEVGYLKAVSSQYGYSVVESTDEELDKAIKAYQARDRRFGGVKK